MQVSTYIRVSTVQRIACDAGATDGAAGLPRACALRPLSRAAAARAACARDRRASRDRRDLRERSRGECGSGGGALARARRPGLRDAQAALQRDARARALHALGAQALRSGHDGRHACAQGAPLLPVLLHLTHWPSFSSSFSCLLSHSPFPTLSIITSRMFTMRGISLFSSVF